MTTAAVRLEVTIERKAPELPRFAVVPARAVSRFGLTGTTTVTGSLAGVPIGRRSLKAWEGRGWFIDLPEALCRAAGVDTGDRVALVLELASTALPTELERLLARDAAARRAFEALTPARRRALVEDVLAAKRSETRERRARRGLGLER